MNKAERHRRKMVRYKRRSKLYGTDHTKNEFNTLRSHGKPCSCWMCTDDKYSRKIKHKNGWLQDL